MGDFYETFDEDARDNRPGAGDSPDVPVRWARGSASHWPGIPYHALDSYLARLVKRGYKVAICEQTGEVSSKGRWSAKVVRVVTPGTVTEPSLLDQSANNLPGRGGSARRGSRPGIRGHNHQRVRHNPDTPG